ncbi:hypothetical protein E4T43_00776 [Aureobasidium subglaciale]|nr:hypothetical protein E4T43_00776 [Aureobasidium subglaciale]
MFGGEKVPEALTACPQAEGLDGAVPSGIFHRQQYINHHYTSFSNNIHIYIPVESFSSPISTVNMSTIAAKSIKALAPLLDRVLVQRIKAETKTAGGIFLPESAVKELNEAKVLAVGPGAFDRDGKRIAPSVQPGDKVLIPQFGGSPIKIGEDEYSLFRDHELLAKINE